MNKNPLKHLLRIVTGPTVLWLEILILVLLLLSNGMSLAIPILSSTIMDTFFRTKTIDSIYFWIIGVIIVLNVVVSFFQSYVTNVVSERVAYALRKQITQKYLQQTYAFISEQKPSKILTVAMSDVNFVKQVALQIVTSLITSVLLLVGSAVIMFKLDVKVAIPVVLIVPLVLFLVMFIFRSATSLFNKGQQARDAINKIIDENIKAAMLIRVFVSNHTESHKFEGANENMRTVGISITNLFALVIPIIQLASLLGGLLVLYIGGNDAIVGHLTIGELTALNTYVVIFTLPILILGFITSAMGQAFASLGRINDILDAPVTFKNGKEKIDSLQRIALDDVTYQVDNIPVLNQVNFSIKRGEKVGIIGLTGSGKTTVLNQILRLLEPTAGHVYINGKDIQEVDINTLYPKVGFVFQENFLLDGSIADNVRFGRKISRPMIDIAARIADVTEFSNRFPEGLAHQVGERGILLSGGQKQRIMIARALAGNPELLILDDSTSMLDITTEQKIMANIKKSFKDISIIIVSQKIASIRDCDKIYVMDQGKVINEGTHDELLKESTLYEEIEMTQRNYRMA